MKSYCSTLPLLGDFSFPKLATSFFFRKSRKLRTFSLKIIKICIFQLNPWVSCPLACIYLWSTIPLLCKCQTEYMLLWPAIMGKCVVTCVMNLLGAWLLLLMCLIFHSLDDIKLIEKYQGLWSCVTTIRKHPTCVYWITRASCFVLRASWQSSWSKLGGLVLLQWPPATAAAKLNGEIKGIQAGVSRLWPSWED